MRLIILLATLAIALPFIISGVTMPFGNAVSERFLERPTHKRAPSYTIPRETAAGEPLDAASLISWVRENSDFANGYAKSVIPIDMLYLLFLGGFLAFASTTLVAFVRWPITLSAVPIWIWLLLPVFYIVSDFVEDGLIFIMLRWPSTIDGTTVNVLAFVRQTKIVTVTLSIVQVLLICLVSYIPTSRPDG
jgi:hypothetical protein